MDTKALSELTEEERREIIRRYLSSQRGNGLDHGGRVPPLAIQRKKKMTKSQMVNMWGEEIVSTGFFQVPYLVLAAMREDLTFLEVIVFLYLSSFDGDVWMTNKAIAEELDIHPMSMSSTLRSLERKGWIETYRANDPWGRRVRYISCKPARNRVLELWKNGKLNFLTYF